jgi:hypothetical protein
MILHVAAVFKICLYVVKLSGFKRLACLPETPCAPESLAGVHGFTDPGPTP